MATDQDSAIDNPQIESGMREAYYKQEIEHFYLAELYHDQRASWLLALASGLLTLVLGSLYAMNESKLSKSGQLLMVLGVMAFGSAIFWGLFALWPLSGRKGQLWNPVKKYHTPPKEPGPFMSTYEHLNAHRRRAAIKANRVIMVILCLGAGLLASIVGIALALIYK